MSSKQENHNPKAPPVFIAATEFDQKFDAGEDVTEYLDLDNVRVYEAGEIDRLSTK